MKNKTAGVADAKKQTKTKQQQQQQNQQQTKQTRRDEILEEKENGDGPGGAVAAPLIAGHAQSGEEDGRRRARIDGRRRLGHRRQRRVVPQVELQPTHPTQIGEQAARQLADRRVAQRQLQSLTLHVLFPSFFFSVRTVNKTFLNTLLDAQTIS